MPGYSAGQCDPNDANQSTINPNFNPLLAPYDLTRGGSFYNYNGHTDVKELALYVQDQIKVKQCCSTSAFAAICITV